MKRLAWTRALKAAFKMVDGKVTTISDWLMS